MDLVAALASRHVRSEEEVKVRKVVLGVGMIDMQTCSVQLAPNHHPDASSGQSRPCEVHV